MRLDNKANKPSDDRNFRTDAKHDRQANSLAISMDGLNGTTKLASAAGEIIPPGDQGVCDWQR